MKDSPGFSFGLNLPSKNCVAQWSLVFVTGLVKVTTVPTGTRMNVGNMPPTAVESGAAVAAALVRASSTVLFTVAPSTAVPDTSLRLYGGVGVGAGGTVPPSLNAHR